MPTKQRLQVESGLRAPITRPVAAPVDTFAPDLASSRQLSQLAKGLAEVSPQVGQLGITLFEKGKEDSYVAGEQAARALQEKGASFAEAQRKGLIAPSANPFFTQGLKEQFGRVAADTWQSDLTAAVNQDEGLQKSTDMKDFDAFVVKHRQDWLTANVGDGRDGAFEQGFGHRADAYYADERRKFASRLEGRLNHNAYEAAFQEVKRHVTDNLVGLSPEAIAADINASNDSFLAQGRNGTDVNKATIDAIVGAAYEHPELSAKAFQILDHVKGGSGGIRNTSYATKTVDEAKEKIADRMFQNHAREKSIAEERKKESTDAILNEATKRLINDRNADNLDLVKALTDIGAPHEAVAALQQLQGNVNSLGVRTDEGVKRDLYGRIWTADSGSPEEVTTMSIMSAMSRGKLRPEDADWLNDNLKRAREARKGAGEGIFDDPDFKSAFNDIDATLPGIIDLDGSRGVKVRNAHAEFRDRWQELLNSEKGKQMDSFARRDWLLKTSEAITKRLKENSPAVNVKALQVPPPEMKSSRELTETVNKITDIYFTETELRAMGQAGRPSDKAIKKMLELGIPPTTEGSASFFKRQRSLIEEKYGKKEEKK